MQSLKKIHAWAQMQDPLYIYKAVEKDSVDSDNFSEAGLKLRVPFTKLIFLFLNQNICCGYSKDLSQ